MRATKQVDDAGAEIEAVQHHVGRQHKGDQARTRGFHGLLLIGIRRQRTCASVDRRQSGIRSVLDLAPHQEQEQDRTARVYIPMKPSSVNSMLPAETIGEKPSAVRMQSVDQPGLAAEFGRHPAGRVGDVRERQREHQDPEHPARVEESSAPEQERGERHDRDEDRPQADHDVIAVIEQRDVVAATDRAGTRSGPDLGLPAPVGQEAQDVRAPPCGLSMLLLVHVGLADDDERRAGFRVEQAFHRGQRGGLIAGDQLRPGDRRWERSARR